jgi:hypothetical protein
VIVGSHPNFPKEPGLSDQTEAAREIFQCAQQEPKEEKGRRVSDRWIPSKFPERTRTVRSDRSCARLTIGKSQGEIPK